jgi:hypothetical protein
MVRDTSIEAYKKVMDCGFVGRKQKLVYDCLYSHGPCTATELFQHLRKGNVSNENIVTRLGELRDMGIVAEVDKRECKVTGYRVLVWDCTSKHPIKMPKKKTKAEKKVEIKDEIIALSKIIDGEAIDRLRKIFRMIDNI